MKSKTIKEWQKCVSELENLRDMLQSECDDVSSRLDDLLQENKWLKHILKCEGLIVKKLSKAEIEEMDKTMKLEKWCEEQDIKLEGEFDDDRIKG